MTKGSYETYTQEQVLEEFSVTKEEGLSEKEAKARLEKYGKNELKEKDKKSFIRIFLSQLNDPLIFVLFAAIFVTIGVSIYETIKTVKQGESFSFVSTGDWPDVIIILAVIIINAVIGSVQEIKAETSLEALKKMSSPSSTIIRDGKKIRIKASELVPGDIVYIEEGDTIGADLRLLEAVNLKINESSLTGESVPVEKNADFTITNEVSIGDRINLAYQSTTVSYGRGCGVVVNTGMNTEIGRIAKVLDEQETEPTPLQKVLAKLSKFLGILTLIIVVLVLIVDIIWIFIDGKGSQIEAYIEAVLSSISLAVAAVPEGLAAVVTIVLSIGVQRMVKANTIVRKLPSVETLGAVSVVCSDKTGTLTQNKMTVLKAYINHEIHDEEEFNLDSKNDDLKLLASSMSLCSNANANEEGEFGDPTEVALVVMANKFGLTKNILEEKYKRVDELPFDSVRKMMSTKHDLGDNKAVIYTKGALDSIISRCKTILINGQERAINKEDIDKINEANTHFAGKALRVLAVAQSNNDKITEEDLCFIGLVAMIDPPRKEAKGAVEVLKNAGITTVMITGDHKDTAFAVAKELGIVDDIRNCYTGKEIDNLSIDELKEVCKTARVFARVSPENKVQIVSAFESLGNICAMTGDGVNDAPSLKVANIGIAMGITGTDVAKDAADMVLTDDNFSSIEKAVEEGRGIYANIKKTVLFLLSSNIAEVLAMFILILIGLPAPLIAIHLLWVNLITDSLPAIALGMQPKDKGVMNEKPRDPNEGIFAKGGALITFGYGAIITIGVIIAYFSCAWLNGVFGIANVKAFYTENVDMLNQARTMAFTTLAFGELFHMLGMTDIKHSFVHIFKEKNYMLWISFGLGILLQLFVIEVPGVSKVFSTANLSIKEWLITAAISILPLLVHELSVLINYIKNKKQQNN